MTVLYGSGCVQTKPLIMRLGWRREAWSGGRGSEEHQEKFVWKEVCLPFWPRGNGEGMWCSTLKAGAADETSWLYFSNRWHRSRFASWAAFAPVTYILTWLRNKLLGQPRQLGPGKRPSRCADLLSNYRYSFINSLQIYWTLSIFSVQGIQPWTKHIHVLLLRPFSLGGEKGNRQIVAYIHVWLRFLPWIKSSECHEMAQ